MQKIIISLFLTFVITFLCLLFIFFNYNDTKQNEKELEQIKFSLELIEENLKDINEVIDLTPFQVEINETKQEINVMKKLYTNLSTEIEKLEQQTQEIIDFISNRYSR